MDRKTAEAALNIIACTKVSRLSIATMETLIHIKDIERQLLLLDLQNKQSNICIKVQILGKLHVD